jgi:hypothetical protein
MLDVKGRHQLENFPVGCRHPLESQMPQSELLHNVRRMSTRISQLWVSFRIISGG